MRRRPASLFRFLLLTPLAASAFILLSCGGGGEVTEPLPGPTSGGMVAGTLTANGGAVADAVVRLESVADGVPASVAALKAGADPAKAVRITASDAVGRYAFADLAAGSYLLSTIAEDHLAGHESVDISPTAAAAAETTIVDIELMPTGTFTGIVTLQNASMHASTVVYVNGTSYVSVTDDAGGYVMTGVPIGTHVVRATHSGWYDQEVGGTLTEAGEEATLPSMVLPRETNIAPTVTIEPLVTLPALNIFDPIPFVATAADVDGTIELVEWDFEDDGTFDYSHPSELTVNWLMSMPGSYRAKIRVTDDVGGIGLSVLEYEVYDAIYVWGEEGDDAGLGIREEPVRTIQQGITLASPQGLPVIVHTGTYAEEVTFLTNVSVYGGYEHGEDWTRTPGSYSTIWLQSYYEHSAVAQNVSDLTISGFRIEAEMAQGDATPAIALKLIDCGPTVSVVDCQIIAGSGAAAFTSGEDGEPAAAAADGQKGEDGCQSTSCFEALGGKGYPWYGGNGGDCDDGEDGSGPYGGAGGTSITSSGVAGDGQNALVVIESGADGPNALYAPAGYGTVASLDWVPGRGSSGFDGDDGSSGSGGGGGGGRDVSLWIDFGGGGGGGGGRGHGGHGGAGGYSGGPSIAVFCVNCTAVIDSCHIETGDGGNGWRGGDGSLGGTGGVGGAGGAAFVSGSSRSGFGGMGAPGGPGGGAGGGQGGPGGPSVGVYNYNSGPILINITYVIGAGGAGGPGGWHANGLSQGPTGGTGPTAQVYDHP